MPGIESSKLIGIDGGGDYASGSTALAVEEIEYPRGAYWHESWVSIASLDHRVCIETVSEPPIEESKRAAAVTILIDRVEVEKIYRKPDEYAYEFRDRVKAAFDLVVKTCERIGLRER